MIKEDHASYLKDRDLVFPLFRQQFCGCALAMAVAGLLDLKKEPICDISGAKIYGDLKVAIPGIQALKVECPECRDGELDPLLETVDHLHAAHLWSAKEIIEWLKPIEESAEKKEEEEDASVESDLVEVF